MLLVEVGADPVPQANYDPFWLSALMENEIALEQARYNTQYRVESMCVECGMDCYRWLLSSESQGPEVQIHGSE
jgi:hypothetical protein